MKRFFVVLLVLIVAVAGFLYFPRGGEALSALNSAVLAVLRGDVDAQRANKDFEPAIDGELLATGDVVRANQEGRAVLTFFDGSTLSVEPGSQVKVLSHARAGGDGLQVTIEQLSGRTWASVRALTTPGSRFELRTPTLTAVVRGTAFETLVEIVNGQPVTTVRTTEGSVLVQAEGGGETIVTAGNQVTVPEGGQAPPAQPQPPTPRLQVQGNVQYLVIDPHGRSCGTGAGGVVRLIPRCDVQGGAVTIGDVVSGVYAFALTTQQPGAASLTVEGFRGATRDFALGFPRAMNAGEIVRTTLPVAVGPNGALNAGQFTPAEVVTSVCGAEARGTAFATGKVEERGAALEAFARTSPGQPAAFVVTQAEVGALLQQGAADANATGGVNVSGLSVTIDTSGLHLAATAQVGPLTVPAKADVIAGASGGRLVLRIRSLDLGPLPSALKDPVARAIEASLEQLAEGLPLTLERVALRPGCVALMGTTRP
ncbi:MAG TPA: FecR family protein [Candidatus Limnocylindria bacterium]|nr:FecR family protein [Candidatus Limnocylindria bacterium]